MNGFPLPLDEIAAVWSVAWPALVIAVLRIGDVSLNVFRMVLVMQERRLFAALVAGTEASVWVAAAGIVFADLSPVRVAGFVVGVACGSAVGIEVARRLQLGMTTVRIYADADRVDDEGRPMELGRRIADAIHMHGHGATVFRGTGFTGPVDMVLSTVRRRHAQQVVDISRQVDPSTFAAVDNTLHPSPMAMNSSISRV